MKKLTTLTCAAATALFLSLLGSASAGTLTLTSGPTFSGGSVSSNSITADQARPELVRIFGSALIRPFQQGAAMIVPAGNAPTTVTLSIGGNFSATPEDMASYFYNFSLNLASAAPVTFELRGTVTVGGFPFEAFTTGPQAIAQGANDFTGAGSVAIPPLAFQIGGNPLNGTFLGELVFSFSAPSADDTLSLDIPGNSIDFQIAPTAIPEPSTYVLLAVGIAALVVRSRRRLRA